MRRMTFGIAAVCLVLAAAAAPAADRRNGESTATEQRALEVERVASLATSGERLFAFDKVKKDGFGYCSAAADLVNRGEFRAAIREASKALFLGQQARETWLLANAHRDLALAYSFAGDLEMAASYAGEAVELANQHFNKTRRDVGSVWVPGKKVLADVALRLDDFAGAARLYAEALSYTRPESRDRAYLHVALAMAHIKAGTLPAARKALDEAPNAPMIAAFKYRAEAELAMAQGEPQKAIDWFRGIDQVTGDKAHDEVFAQSGIARAELKLGRAQEAAAAYRAAIEAANTMRGRFRSDVFRAGFFDSVQDIFDQAIDLAMQSGQPAQAFQLAEQARARAVLDLIRGRVAVAEAGFIFNDKVARSAEVGEIQAALAPGELLVAFRLGRSHSHAWLVSREKLRGVTLPISEEAVALEVRRFRRGVETRSGDADQAAAALHTALIAPLALDGTKLVIVPHQALHYLPFEALRGGSGYLFEAAEIGYAPSASALLTLRSRAAGAPGVYLAGNPASGGRLAPLPGAEAEVTTIAAMFGTSDVLLVTGAKATRESFLSSAPGRGVIHLATHAEVDEVDPLYSRIYFAATDGVSGILEAHEIAKLKLDGADLVTLSACESGLGRVSAGDEFYGFKHTFFAAGARALLVSLWQVEDAATSQLMQDFYRGPTSDRRRALRQAQHKLLADPRTRHPYFWSSFVLVGNAQ